MAGGAFSAALVAQQGGNAQGQVAAYQDQVAQAADMQRLSQQQQQFDAQQALAQQEFQAQNKIAIDQDIRAQTAADATTRADRGPSPGDSYGGYQYQLNQQAIKAGSLANQGAAANITGKNLANQAQGLDNLWTPIMNNLKVLTAEQDLANNVGRDPASEQQRAIALQQASTDIQKNLYTWKASVDVAANAADKTVITKEYENAEKGVVDALKGLDTKGTSDKPGPSLGKPVNLVDDALRQAAAVGAERIRNSPDPTAAADQLIAQMTSGGQLSSPGGMPYVAQYFAAIARQAVVQRAMYGTKAPAAPAALPQAVPYGLNLQRPGAFSSAIGNRGNAQGAFSSAIGGSNAATPFAQP